MILDVSVSRALALAIAPSELIAPAQAGGVRLAAGFASFYIVSSWFLTTIAALERDAGDASDHPGRSGRSSR